MRAVVIGARRTAEELGRAFPGTAVITSSGDAVVPEVATRPALVVATPGPNPGRPAGTARRCCWIPGRCWGDRICARPRTRCGAGWRRRRWCVRGLTAVW
ncbi:putative primosome assembly protein PriA [Mycobacterium kansasii]|uniref:Putative primosome assembly protein PriA n=1 Tax=Mycobacterium kansasii TaxID=1768 RepID=A0A1V3WDC3_MYCKA|nr:putative primosome assembly protein PriA [Mycobacterium kansasii]